MANQHSVARRDGVFKTNNVVVEAGWLVASDYELTLNAHQQIGATGLLKGFQLAPSDPASSSASQRIVSARIKCFSRSE